MPAAKTVKNDKKSALFVLFGATGDLAVKKIFPALDALVGEGLLGPAPHIIAVSRRDWSSADFHSFLKEKKSAVNEDFLRRITYSKVDIEAGSGFDELASLIKELQNAKRGAEDHEVLYYASIAPAHQERAAIGLKDAGMLYRRSGSKLLLEKPFGTDLETACALDKLLLSFLDENQICRVDHYLGKDTVRAVMDLQESTSEFSNIISSDNVASIRVRVFEEKGIDSRGASYDGVGAFRDVGQNHLLEMLAVVIAELPKKSLLGKQTPPDWRTARATALKRLAPPTKTCDLSRRGQYAGYGTETGVREGSDTETAFEVVTNLSSGRLKGVPLILEAGKKMGVSEAYIEIRFKDVPGLPKIMSFRVQPEQEVVIEGQDGKIDSFDIPKARDAYGNVILAALESSHREFVGSKEIEALWSYADRIVGCWSKVPLESYSPDKPFISLIQ